MSLVSFFSGLFSAGPDRTISYADLTTEIGAGRVRVIDVREPREFAGGHVPGATNVPLSRFDPVVLPRDKPVVLICQSGGRSGSALRKAVEAGRDDVRHFAGGTAGWKQRGGRVV